MLLTNHKFGKKNIKNADSFQVFWRVQAQSFLSLHPIATLLTSNLIQETWGKLVLHKAKGKTTKRKDRTNEPTVQH